MDFREEYNSLLKQIDDLDRKISNILKQYMETHPTIDIGNGIKLSEIDLSNLNTSAKILVHTSIKDIIKTTKK